MTLRVAIAGFGFAGGVRHRLAYQRDGRAEVVAILDPDPDRRRAARRLGLRAVENVEALEQIPSDAWSVCSPPHAHLALAQAALQSGRHVLVEKPLTPTVSESRTLVDLAARQQRVLAVGHNFLWADAWQTLGRWRAAGRLGPIHSVQAVQWSGRGRAVPPWTQALPGGLLFDELPHHLYLARDLLGPLSVKRAWSEGPRLQATLHGEQGFASLSAWMDAPRTEWWLAVSGREGTALIDLFRDAALFLPGEPKRSYRSIAAGSATVGAGLLKATATQGIRRLRGRHLYGTGRLVSRFLDGIQHKPSPRPLPDGRDGLEVVQLLNQLLRRAGLPSD